MNNKRAKLENPSRLDELKPTETLKRIGLGESHTLVDIGAGSGIFTLPAARITKNKVYALEINEEMLSIIDEKAKSEGAINIELIKVQGDKFTLEDQAADIVLLVTVLHEIQNKTALLKEVKRILKGNGKVVIIEFHKSNTPMGPPIANRIAKQEVICELQESGFLVHEEFDLGDNFYCLVFILKD